jgi:hypothetical protein
MYAKRMRPGFTLFALFFGVSLLEALQERKWVIAAFWLIIGFTFLQFDRANHEAGTR